MYPLGRSILSNTNAIFLQYLPAHDSASIVFDTPDFLKMSDSINTVFTVDQPKVDMIMSKDLASMNIEVHTYLKNVFLANRDYANYRYYGYLVNYGVQGPAKPLQNESGDVIPILL